VYGLFGRRHIDNRSPARPGSFCTGTGSGRGRLENACQFKRSAIRGLFELMGLAEPD
jgi:hypothetical protein